MQHSFFTFFYPLGTNSTAGSASLSQSRSVQPRSNVSSLPTTSSSAGEPAFPLQMARFRCVCCPALSRQSRTRWPFKATPQAKPHSMGLSCTLVSWIWLTPLSSGQSLIYSWSNWFIVTMLYHKIPYLIKNGGISKYCVLDPKHTCTFLKSQILLTLISCAILTELCRICLVFLLLLGTASGRSSTVIGIAVIGKICSF